MHDPPVPLPHHLPLLLLLHGWVPLSLPHPVPGLAGGPDAAQPLPNDGGVLLKREKKMIREREREIGKEKRAKGERKGKMKHDNNAGTRRMGYLFVTKQLPSFPTRAE